MGNGFKIINCEQIKARFTGRVPLQDDILLYYLGNLKQIHVSKNKIQVY